ncbi:ankyrin [Cenococcum geophilum 1.58]|uniref:ankyrin n=1 Tax=Cenococcum geophilum 1.58 TaxID=794803 RepID=UPI00358FA057|nr:ankyrin [Cenococcum geophilum 1.58]
MDPLSVIASSVTIAQLLLGTLRTLNRIRNAPAEVSAALTELEQLQRVFRQVEAIFRQRQSGDDGLTESSKVAFESVLVSANVELQSIHQTMDTIITVEDTESGAFRISHTAWLRKRQWIKAVCARLRDLKLSLAVLNGSVMVADTMALSATLHNIESGSLAEIADTQNRSLLLLQEILQQQEQQQLFCRSIAIANNSTPGYTSTPFFVTTLPSSQEKASSDVADPGDRVSTQSVDPLLSRKIGNRCNTGCSCRCHRPTKFSTPAWLTNILGNIHIGSVGIPRLAAECNEKLCQKQGFREARMVFFFPPWLVARILSFTYSSRGTMQLVLRVPRVVSDEAPILQYAAGGDLDSIRILMSKGLASPADVGHSYSMTALHIAYVNKDIEMCRFLVQQGADPYYGSSFRRAVIDIVRDESVNGMLDPKQRDEFCGIFHEMEDYESFQLSPLHKSILGLSQVNLEMQLSTSTAWIDVQDTLGRTPLNVATWRGNVSAVSTLLKYNASPMICTPTEMSPVHRAIEGRSYECVHLLLQYGADVNHKNKRGRQPLHYCCRIDDNARICSLLLQSGGHVNGQDHGAGRPIHESIMHNKLPQLALLISYGAEVDCKTSKGEFPLNLAVGNSNVEAIRLLLDAGADPSLQTNLGHTILHTAAVSADMETLRFLASVELRGLSHQTQNKKGETARDLFNLRCDSNPAELEIPAFQKLWNKLEDSIYTYDDPDSNTENFI